MSATVIVVRGLARFESTGRPGSVGSNVGSAVSFWQAIIIIITLSVPLDWWIFYQHHAISSMP